MLSLTVKSSGGTIPVLRSIIRNICEAQSSHNANRGGLLHKLRISINLAQTYPSPTGAMRLAKDPFSIAPRKANSGWFCFLNKTHCFMEILMLELIKIKYHLYF